MSEAVAPEANDEQAVTRPVLLRQAREAAGLHIAALAAALKVPVRKLEALEAGRYNELPDMTFARALASSACRHLKVDPAPVLAQLPANPSPSLGDLRQTINAPFKTADDEPSFSPWGWLSRPAVLGAIALLLAALVIVFLPAADPVSESVTATAIVPVAVSPVTTGQDPVVAAPAAAPASAPDVATTTPPPSDQADASVPATPGAPTVEPSPAPTVPAPPADPAVASSSALLSIVASEESWAEVVNGTGTVVLQRLLQPGERVEFSAAPPYAVVLGRAEGVRVTVRGRLLDTSPLVRNNVARFEVK